MSLSTRLLRRRVQLLAELDCMQDSRAAARQSFRSFSPQRRSHRTQGHFVELIVDLLTRRGYVDPAQLFDAPLTNSHPQGLSGLFTDPPIHKSKKC